MVRAVIRPAVSQLQAKVANWPIIMGPYKSAPNGIVIWELDCQPLIGSSAEGVGWRVSWTRATLRKSLFPVQLVTENCGQPGGRNTSIFSLKKRNFKKLKKKRSKIVKEKKLKTKKKV